MVLKFFIDLGVLVINNILCFEKDENYLLYLRFYYIYVRIIWVLLYILVGKWMLLLI